MEFLTVNKILESCQMGFREFNSTHTVLIKLTDDIRTGMVKKLATLPLQFNYSKVFDTISPSLLNILYNDSSHVCVDVLSVSSLNLELLITKLILVSIRTLF